MLRLMEQESEGASFDQRSQSTGRKGCEYDQRVVGCMFSCGIFDSLVVFVRLVTGNGDSCHLTRIREERGEAAYRRLIVHNTTEGM
jgi:hypothetical protein